MATQRSSFAKLQRDRDKKAKAAAKRERRQERKEAAAAGEPEAPPEEAPAPTQSPEEVMRLLEQTHADFDDGVIDFEKFEERKAELLSRLSVE